MAGRRADADGRRLLPAFGRACRALPAAGAALDLHDPDERGCPKDRFIETPDGEVGLNYLCAGYKDLFHHVYRAMRLMSQLLQRGRAPSEIVTLHAAEDAHRARNEPCTCGSGRKWKHCHGLAPAA